MLRHGRSRPLSRYQPRSLVRKRRRSADDGRGASRIRTYNSTREDLHKDRRCGRDVVFRRVARVEGRPPCRCLRGGGRAERVPGGGARRLPGRRLAGRTGLHPAAALCRGRHAGGPLGQDSRACDQGRCSRIRRRAFRAVDRPTGDGTATAAPIHPPGRRGGGCLAARRSHRVPARRAAGGGAWAAAPSSPSWSGISTGCRIYCSSWPGPRIIGGVFPRPSGERTRRGVRLLRADRQGALRELSGGFLAAPAALAPPRRRRLRVRPRRGRLCGRGRAGAGPAVRPARRMAVEAALRGRRATGRVPGRVRGSPLARRRFSMRSAQPFGRSACRCASSRIC